MKDEPRTGSRFPGWLKALLKIAITIACLWYVSGKIDFTKAGVALGKANWILLACALVLFIMSKIVSAFRLNIYFQNIGIQLNIAQSLKLYWLGMFYNLFLPGSISGDAYKVILLSKKYNKPYKKLTAAVLLDRFSGLAGLGLILAAYGFIVLDNRARAFYLGAGVLIALVGFYWLIRKWFKDFLPGFYSTFFLGIVVQAIQVACVYLIMISLQIPVSITAYIFIFLVSSVVSVLPLTIGGLGIREIVFLEGSKYFSLTQEVSVLISLLFYLITLFTSACGMIYVFKNPLSKKDELASKKTPAL